MLGWAGGLDMIGLPGKLHATRSLLVVALLATGQAALGDGPWSGKQRNEWDRNDVRKILYDSPWARHFSWTRKPVESQVPDMGPTGDELRGYHSTESKDDGSETTEFYVRWVSSRTLREASLRRAALLGHDQQGAPVERDPPALKEFEIAVTGPDLSDFEGVREATLKSKCVLFASSRRKAAPTRVEIARSANGTVRGLLFCFPRTMSTGEPLISTHDRKVLFLSRAGGVEIRTTFNPQIMVDGKGLDL